MLMQIRASYADFDFRFSGKGNLKQIIEHPPKIIFF